MSSIFRSDGAGPAIELSEDYHEGRAGMKWMAIAGWGLAAVGTLVTGTTGDVQNGLITVAKAAETPVATNLVLPKTNSKKGRELYVSKGCIVCHAINSVGGGAAAPLDAATMDPSMNPFEFFARMWLGTEPMLAMQKDKMGKQVEITTQELADIVAFVHDAQAQNSFSAAEIPGNIKKLMD